MDDQTRGVLERFWLAADGLHKLGKRARKVAPNLSPSDREEVLKSATIMKTFTERLRQLAAETGTSAADLCSGIEESTEKISSTIESLGRILVKVDDPDQPAN